ncbi:MAG: hypothetical protein RI894_2487 [Bacteroidota bacterium]|jgi:hypothetical protein
MINKKILLLSLFIGFASLLLAQKSDDEKDIRVMPFSQYVDLPARPLPKKDKYPYTQHFFTYTLWDSLETKMTLYSQKQWGDYSFIWHTENGMCKLGDQEFGPNTDEYSEGAYLFSSDSVSYFYSKGLKDYYQRLLHQTNAPTPMALPTGFFESIKQFNESKYIGHLDVIPPVKMWWRQLGVFDTVLVFNGNMDKDPEQERIVVFRAQKIDNRGYRTYRLLVCNKGADKRWYVYSALDVTNFITIDFDAAHQAFVVSRELGRGGTGQSYQDGWQDIYKWEHEKIGTPLPVYSERDHDTDQDSPYFFDRDRRAYFTWIDANTVEVTDSIHLYGSVWRDEQIVDKSTYTWSAEAMEFTATASTAWERPPSASRLDTVPFQLYTRWDSIPVTAVRKWSINPLLRKYELARSLENEWYIVNGKQYDYEKGACSTLLYNPPHHYNDITSSSCALSQQVADWNSSLNAPAPIPISDELLYYVNISKNLDTLMGLNPLKYWYNLIADSDRPEIDQVKRMEVWQGNLDEDADKESVWFISDGTHLNNMILIVDKINGKHYITSCVNTGWFNRMPVPRVDAKSKLIVVVCPKGRYEDTQFYRYSSGKLKKVLALESGVEIGGLRQELQTAYYIKNENKLEVYYTYNLFFEKNYPENEAMKLGFLNNKEAQVTFEFNGNEFAQTAAEPALPPTSNQKNNSIMGAFLHAYQAELEEVKLHGEVSKRELLNLYLDAYLRKFAVK